MSSQTQDYSIGSYLNPNPRSFRATRAMNITQKMKSQVFISEIVGLACLLGIIVAGQNSKLLK
ncbi:MAG: hypothetical protein SCH66_07400 [Methanolobus sp.]|nr:hypothetical protein [Methanolobus sp.]